MTLALATQSDNQAMQDLLSENLGGMALNPEDLIKVSIPTGGGVTWEIPTGAGDDVNPVKAIVGVVIAQMPMRLAFNSEKQLVCKSEDAKIGAPIAGLSFDGIVPSGICGTCPLNQWGSKGRGKACADKMRLYIMREDDVLPILITLPPTSLAAWRKYVISLSTIARKAFHNVKTVITLKKIVQDGRDPYSTVQFALGAPMDEGEAAYHHAFRLSFMEMLQASLAQVAEQDAPIQSGMNDEFMAAKPPTAKAQTIVDDVPTF